MTGLRNIFRKSKRPQQVQTRGSKTAHKLVSRPPPPSVPVSSNTSQSQRVPVHNDLLEFPDYIGAPIPFDDAVSTTIDSTQREQESQCGSAALDGTTSRYEDSMETNDQDRGGSLIPTERERQLERWRKQRLSIQKQLNELGLGHLPHGKNLSSGWTEEEYNWIPLFTGKQVKELWFEDGDTLIYLGPKDSDHPPSFFVDSLTLLASSEFFAVAFSPVWQASHVIDTVKYPTAKYSLYFSPERLLTTSPGRVHSVTNVKVKDQANDDALKLLKHYIVIRNIIGFVFRTYCVGLEGYRGLLKDMSERMLMYFEGVETGVAQQMGVFITESGLWDVRNEPEKALELLLFASNYSIDNLMLESMIHCVGMYDQVIHLESFETLPESIIKLLDNAYKAQISQIAQVTTILQDFHCPSIWSRKSPSKQAPTLWRRSYEVFREFLRFYYKKALALSSSWPPKSFPSRSLILLLQSDLTAIYDLLVNSAESTETCLKAYPIFNAFITTMQYFDKSCNNQSSLPYSLPNFPGPIVPKYSGILPNFANYKYPLKHKLTLSEVGSEYDKTYNTNSHSYNRPIVGAFRQFEKRLGKGRTVKELVDQRAGIWLLLYGLLSTLANVVVEDEVVFEDGVDYFLLFGGEQFKEFIKSEELRLGLWGEDGGGDERETGEQSGGGIAATAIGVAVSGDGPAPATVTTDVAEQHANSTVNTEETSRRAQSYCWKVAEDGFLGFKRSPPPLLKSPLSPSDTSFTINPRS